MDNLVQMKECYESLEEHCDAFYGDKQIKKRATDARKELQKISNICKEFRKDLLEDQKKLVKRQKVKGGSKKAAKKAAKKATKKPAKKSAKKSTKKAVKKVSDSFESSNDVISEASEASEEYVDEGSEVDEVSSDSEEIEQAKPVKIMKNNRKKTS